MAGVASDISFAAFVAGPWKRACYYQCKPSTRKRVDSALKTQLLPAFGDLALDQVRPACIYRWFESYSRTAPGGANRTLDVLKQIFNFAVRSGYLENNPTNGLKRNPRTQRTRFLSRAEVDRLYVALDSHRGRGSGQQQADIIRLLLLTGCRKTEIAHLRWSEVDGNILLLRDSKTGPRMVFLNSQAQAILLRQPRKGNGFVFPCLQTGSGPRSTDLSLWDKVRRQAGIEDVRLHDLRHTFASHAVMCRVPLPVVSRLLGHRSPQMTLRYAHVSDRETEEAAERVGVAMALALSLD